MLPFSTGVLDPRGSVAANELLILQNATLVMLALIVPIIVLTLVFAWWFRAGNKRAKRKPDWNYSGALEVALLHKSIERVVPQTPDGFTAWSPLRSWACPSA